MAARSLSPRAPRPPRPPRPRIAVIGAGALSTRYHLPSLAHLQKQRRCRLVGLCDLSEKTAARAARTFGFEAVFTDYGQMLREAKPDGVVVIVPIPYTRAVAGDVLKRGYPVMTEKPPGANSRDTAALIRAAGHTPNMVAFNRRFCPVIVQAKLLIEKEGASKGASARMFRSGRHDEEFFYGTGIHALDALRFLGGDLDRVETDARTLKGDTRPAFTLRLSYANGSAGTYTVRPEAGVQLERYELFGPQCVALAHAGVGWLLDSPGSCELYRANKKVRIPDALKPYAKHKGVLLEAMGGGFYGEEAAFVEALATGSGFSPTLAESLQSVQIAEAVQAGRNWKRKA